MIISTKRKILVELVEPILLLNKNSILILLFIIGSLVNWLVGFLSESNHLIASALCKILRSLSSGRSKRISSYGSTSNSISYSCHIVMTFWHVNV